MRGDNQSRPTTFLRWDCKYHQKSYKFNRRWSSSSCVFGLICPPQWPSSIVFACFHQETIKRKGVGCSAFLHGLGKITCMRANSFMNLSTTNPTIMNISIKRTQLWSTSLPTWLNNGTANNIEHSGVIILCYWQWRAASRKLWDFSRRNWHSRSGLWKPFNLRDPLLLLMIQ